MRHSAFAAAEAIIRLSKLVSIRMTGQMDAVDFQTVGTVARI
jgi:hypothetical protein